MSLKSSSIRATQSCTASEAHRALCTAAAAVAVATRERAMAWLGLGSRLGLGLGLEVGLEVGLGLGLGERAMASSPVTPFSSTMRLARISWPSVIWRRRSLRSWLGRECHG